MKIVQTSLLPGASLSIDPYENQRKREEGIRKNKLINEVGELRGFPIRGRDKWA